MTPSTTDSRPLADRYRPNSLRDVVGNGPAINELGRWGQEWSRGPRPPRVRAVILEGPPGVGKTTAALALAADQGWTVVEMNASDARNQSAVEHIAGRAAATQTLGTSGKFRTYGAGARTLILLDEADALTGRLSDAPSKRAPPSTFREFVRGRYGTLDALNSSWGLVQGSTPAPFQRWEQVPATGGRGPWSRRPAAQRDLEEWRSAKSPPDHSDRGGLPAILRLIPETRQPIVLTLNDWTPYARAGAEFRQSARRIRFDLVSRAEIALLLRRVIASERLVVARDALDAILDRSRGDVRAALNDLDAIAPLPPGAAQREVLALRDQPSDFFALTDELLHAPRFHRAGEIRARLDATPDDLLPWIEENVPRVASSVVSVERGLAQVARAERFLALARRQRVWALWSFASEVMAGGPGLAMAAAGTSSSRRPLGFPQYLGLMGRSRISRATRAAIGKKVGTRTHLSVRKATEIELPWIERALRSGHSTGSARGRGSGLQHSLVTEFGLTEEEVEFLLERAAWTDTVRPAPPPKAPRSRSTTPGRDPPNAPEDSSGGDLPKPPAEPRGQQRNLGDY